jgi:predicted alpha/beta hydrolase family esterase
VTTRDTPRLLVVPGLHDSGPAHWQTWLQSRHAGALRVTQDDWHQPDLERWAARITHTLAQAGGSAPWVAAAHSFGCLALVRHLQSRPDSPVRAALLVAPADPARFGLDERVADQPLDLHATLVASRNDPWMALPQAALWARRWGCRWIDLGAAGHINAESGFGPLPLASTWVRAATQRLQRVRRAERASAAEWSFAL